MAIYKRFHGSVFGEQPDLVRSHWAECGFPDLPEVEVSLTVFKKTASLAASALLIRALSSSRLASLRLWFPTSLKRRIRGVLERPAWDARRFIRTPDWELHSAFETNRLTGNSVVSITGPASGVNLYGYFSRWLGLGECARLYAHAMLASGYPVTLHDVDIDIPHERKDITLAPHFGTALFFTHDLIFVNPDHWDDTVQSIGNLSESRHHVIGYWFWELENFPDNWLHAIDKVDEVMVSSAFVEESIRRVCSKPVTRIPLPMVLGKDSGLTRRHFGLRDDSFVFLCTFDFNSSIARKNPYAVIDAFRQAFPRGDEKVTLLIKSSNGDRHGEMLIQLLILAAVDSRIMVRDDMLERHDLQSLHRCIDVYVSLHRSEGFGLGMAEAMCIGKPVVATAYSGNMEFMTRTNSCLVDYTMIPVQQGEYPHASGQRWADPDAGHAAHYFGLLYRDRDLAGRLGAQAAKDMLEGFSIKACMDVLTQRLK